MKAEQGRSDGGGGGVSFGASEVGGLIAKARKRKKIMEGKSKRLRVVLGVCSVGR